MGKEIIVKYEEGKPIYAEAQAPSRKDGGVNGCVSGPPCPTCHWRKGDPSCLSGIYCRKPTYMACP